MRILLALLLFAAFSYANFQIESVDIVLSNIDRDGSVHVRESIKFFVIGEYEQALYKSGFNKNELSFWATTTTLKEIRLHVDTNKVDINDFRLIPQPLRSCDPFRKLCHGELVIEYKASPYYNKSNEEPVAGSGIFSLSKYKPRTIRYSINPDALAFPKSESGDIMLDKHTSLIIELQPGSVVYDINPLPNDYEEGSRSMKWTDTMLIYFTLVFDVEQSLAAEVTEFFSKSFATIESGLHGPEGIALILIAAILLGSYLYLKSFRK